MVLNQRHQLEAWKHCSKVILCSMNYQFLLLNARIKGGRTENKIQTHSGLIYMTGTRLDGKTGFIKQLSSWHESAQYIIFRDGIICDGLAALPDICRDHIKSI